MSMIIGAKEKKYLENQLETIYQLLHNLDKSKVKDEVIFELENINMKLEIPFKD